MTAKTDRPSAMVRMRVMKRDRFACTYCGAPGTDAELEVDHIIAVANGGSNHMSNLTTACRSCNQEKGVRGEDFKANARPARRHGSANGVVGMHLHTFKDDGSLQWQGKVIGMQGDDLMLVQIYEWFMGSAWSVEVLPLSCLGTERVRLYGDADQMIDEGMRIMDRQRRARGVA